MIPPGGTPDAPFHVHSHPAKVEVWRHIIEIAAFIVAAAWAFYVFIYQERIKPAETLPRTEFSAMVTHQPVRSGAEFVDVTFESRNIGTVAVQPAGFVVNTYGIRYLPITGRSITRSLRKNVVVFDVSLATTKPVLLQSVVALFQRFGAPAPFLLTVGRDVKYHHAFAVRAGKYDAVLVRYKYCYARDGDEKAYKPQVSRDAQGAYWIGYEDPNALTDRGMICGSSSLDEFPL